MNTPDDIFTEARYRELLLMAKHRYEFLLYDALPCLKDGVLWRHDVDLSMQRALALAKIEHQEGVCSTYFVQLGSTFYNVFEPEIKDLVSEIRGLGHQIGLHFDPSRYEVFSVDGLERWLRFEKATLDTLFDCSIGTFSFHNPTAETLAFDELRYSGMYNTYARYFQDNIAYCSDSNGYWRYKPLCDVLKGPHLGVLQVLTHPGWWQKEVMAPRNRVSRCIDGRAKAQHLEYDRALKRFDRNNIR